MRLAFTILLAITVLVLIAPPAAAAHSIIHPICLMVQPYPYVVDTPIGPVGIYDTDQHTVCLLPYGP